ncbi:hypothetical protein ACS127_01095 [Amphibacillus sp. Q70]|uniref:hypothetical protein n=1 Tax=Amphibacillus sp. Q70 TaxID=3453416 RepID=UPI003F83C2F2
MNNLKLLFLFRLKNQLKLSNLNSSDPDVQKHAFYTITGYIAAFFMFLGYLLFIAIDLNVNHNIQTFFVLVSSILFWILGIWTILSGSDDLIKGKDCDFIFSLPIKNWQAKLLNLFSKYIIYITLTFITLVFGYMLTVTYIKHFFLTLFFILLLSFIIPLISTNTAFLISLFTRHLLTVTKLRNHVTESIMTLGLFMTPLVYFIFNSQSIDYKEWFINGSILRYPLNEITNYHFMLNILLLIVIAVVTTCLVTYILTAFHPFIESQITKQPKIKEASLVFKVNKPLTALVLKEIKLYFSSLTYVSNTILTPVGMVVLNSCILIGVIPDLHAFSYDLIGLTITAQQLFTLVTFILVMLTTTTSCSLSFEGKGIWIMLTSPTSLTTIALAKIIINVLLFLPGIILTAIVYHVTFDVGLIDLITIVSLLTMTLLLISTVGFLINLKFPSYSWSSDMEVVKQSKATIITAIISMITIPIIISVAYLDYTLLILLTIILEITMIFRMLKKISNNHMMMN